MILCALRQLILLILILNIFINSYLSAKFKHVIFNTFRYQLCLLEKVHLCNISKKMSRFAHINNHVEVKKKNISQAVETETIQLNNHRFFIKCCQM